MSLLDELRNIRSNPSKIKKHLGICSNIKTLELKGEFRRLASKWPKHSGSLSFPVPHLKDPEEGYFNAINMWDRRTAYGKLRWELLNWAIATLESREQ